MRFRDPPRSRYLIRVIVKKRVLRYSLIRRYRMRALNKQPRFRQW